MKALSLITKFRGMKRVDANSTLNLNPEFQHLVQNYYFGGGVLNQRTGCLKRTATALNGSVRSIKQVRYDTGAFSYLVAAGNYWYKTTDFITNTAIKTNAIESPIDVAQFKVTTGHALIANQYMIPQKYDNTTLSALTSSTILTDFVTEKDLSLGSGNTLARTIAKTSEHLYIGIGTSPAKIVKVKLSDMSVVGTLTLATDNNEALSMIIDNSGTYLYVGLQGVSISSTPGRIARITLADFTTVSIFTLATTEFSVRSLAINSTHLYCGVDISGASTIVKITLSDFTTKATVALTGGSVYDLAINSTHLYCIDYSAKKIARVLLSDFTTVAYKTLTTAAPTGLDIDATYLYIAHFGSPGAVTKLTLADFTTEAIKTLATGENYACSVNIDSTGTYLYVTCDTAPIKIVRLTLSDFTTTSTKTLAINGGAGAGPNSSISVIDGIDTFLYTIANADSPSNVTKLSLLNVPAFIETHRSKLWLFGFDNDTYRLYAYYSKTGDATDFTTANDAGYLNFATVLSQYDTPTGMKSWGQYIVFFFTSNILIYAAGTDPNDFQLVKHIKNIGSLTNEVLQVGDDLWFPTLWGIRSLKLASTMEDLPFSEVSQDIDNFWVDNITSFATNTDRISMVYDKIHELILILANASNSQGVSFYVYSIGDKAWSVYKMAGLGANVDVTAVCVSQAGLVYIGTSDGNIYEMYNGTTDNTVAIDYYINPVTQYFGNPIANKKIKYIQVATTDNITSGTVTYDVDKKSQLRTVSSIAKAHSGSKGLGYSGYIQIQNRGRSWDISLLNMGTVREIIFYGEQQSDK